MKRGDDRLEEVLRSAGDEYIRSNPADLHRARERIYRLRRRRQMRNGLVTALGAAAAVAVAVFAWPAMDDTRDRPRPAAPADLPTDSIAIDVGDAPTEVAVGDGVLWVSNSGDDTVSRVDPAVDVATTAVRLSGSPGDLAVGAGGEVWIANPEVGVVQRIDPATGTTTPDLRVDVGPAGTPIDLAIEDFLWVSAVDEELLQVDVSTGEVIRRIDSVRPVNVAARDDAVLVLESDGTVRGIDPATGELNAIELSFDISGRGDIHFYDGVVWVAEGDGSNLYAVDVGGASRRIATYPFRGTYVEMVQVTKGMVVLSDLGDGTGLLTLIDPGTGEATELTEIPGSPRDLVRGLHDLWVSLPELDQVVRIPSLP